MTVPKAEKEAARAVLMALNPRSILENVEYGAAIFKRGSRYLVSDPITSQLLDGIREKDVLSAIEACPKGG